MIKHITLFIVAFLILGCGAKPTSAQIKNDTKTIVTQEVKKSQAVTATTNKEPTKLTLPEGFKEVKKLRAMDSNVPTTCQEWSDGCNTCSRAGNNQASCTVYTCENKAPFSCLKWQ